MDGIAEGGTAMPWTYSQSTGQLRHNGRLIATGYSGAGHNAASGRNNPALQGVRDVGPIPQGLYAIGRPYRHARLGPHVMNLDPVGHDALGRTDFRIHGNNPTNDASQGCIILNRPVRQRISRSGDGQLLVIP
jgi:hypothetical protein